MTPSNPTGATPPQNFCTIDGNRLDADDECPLCRMLGRKTGRLGDVAPVAQPDSKAVPESKVEPKAESVREPEAETERIDAPIAEPANLIAPMPEPAVMIDAAALDALAAKASAEPPTPPAPDAAAPEPAPAVIAPGPVELGAPETQKDEKSAPPPWAPVTPPAPQSDPSNVLPKGGEGDAVEKFRNDFNKIRKAGIYAVTLIGNSSAGKTWLLNRMKHAFLLGGKNVPSIPPAVGPGKQVLPTTEMEIHVFQGEEAQFAIIDIPGELLRLFNEGNYIPAAPIIEAVNYSSALIIAVPSDIVMLGHMFNGIEEHVEDETEEVNGAGELVSLDDRIRDWCADSYNLEETKVDGAMARILSLIDENKKLDLLIQGLFMMAGVMSYLRNNPEYSGGENGIVSERLTKDMVEGHMQSNRIIPLGGRDGLDFPTIMALTKADAFLPFLRVHEEPAIAAADRKTLSLRANEVIHHMLEVSGALDGQEVHVNDPRRLVMANRPALLGQLDRWMPMNRTEFVSAFYGHGGTDKVRYTRPHFGVEALMEWIETTYYIATGKHLPNQFGIPGLAEIDRPSLNRARKARMTLEGRKKKTGGSFGFIPKPAEMARS